MYLWILPVGGFTSSRTLSFEILAFMLWWLFTPPLANEVGLLRWVCLCASVRSHNSKTTRPNFIKMSVHVTIAVWLGPPVAALWYVLPVLWMTSHFHVWLCGTSCVFPSSDRIRHACITSEIPARLCSMIKYSSRIALRGRSLLTTISLLLTRSISTVHWILLRLDAGTFRRIISYCRWK